MEMGHEAAGDIAPKTNLDPNAIEAIVTEVRRALQHDLASVGLAPTGEVEMADRWKGGEVILKPGKPGAQEKEIPIDQLFRKIVLARERLRVLEQKINNHPKLEDGDRLEMQKYVSQIYGSFTTFNILFADRLDWFVGQKNF